MQTDGDKLDEIMKQSFLEFMHEDLSAETKEAPLVGQEAKASSLLQGAESVGI